MNQHKSATEFCYDFPLLVVHTLNCNRYKKGGVCHPLPTPTEPYLPDEAKAVELHNKIMTGQMPIEDMKLVHVLGTTGDIV